MHRSFRVYCLGYYEHAILAVDHIDYDLFPESNPHELSENKPLGLPQKLGQGFCELLASVGRCAMSTASGYAVTDSLPCRMCTLPAAGLVAW